MKPNFVVSTYRQIWISGAKKIFAVEPYIRHELERTGQIPLYDEVVIAPSVALSREELESDNQFVDQKFCRYMEFIPERLDALHGTDYGSAFWRKSLSIALLRHVTYCFQMFKSCEAWLKPGKYDFRVLDESLYRVPLDFDEHRMTFQNSDFGQEQLFSAYCRLFYPETIQFFSEPQPNSGLAQLSVARASKSVFERLFAKNLFSRLTKVLGRRILKARSPTVAVINSFFSAQNFDKLLFRSWGRIQNFILPSIVLTENAPDWEKRRQFSIPEADFDRFDRFVFDTLRHAMPKAFIEDFADINTTLNRHFDLYPKLSRVVSEAWIGDMYSAMAIAILEQRGVKHIFNEHNYIAHAFVGNNLKYLYPQVNKFVSLGWKDSSIPNLVPGGSLFNWVEEPVKSKDIDLLFVSSIPIVRAPEVNSCYGESGRNVESYLQMNLRFFGVLAESTLARMTFRAYPAHVSNNFQAWDQRYILRNFIAKVHQFDDGPSPSRVLMQRSRLVVVNYISTAYLEALLADIPTVVLFNRSAYFFEEGYKAIFDRLFETKIFHSDPEEAAVFIESILDDPDHWWKSTDVRNARSAFLDENMGSPQVLCNYLLAAAAGKN